MEQIAKTFPPGIRYIIPYDTTKFIEVSIKEVVHTLAEALLLVVLVVYLFLQSWRATLLGHCRTGFADRDFCWDGGAGFSINTLTLFGMVLAIGIVVDDAIVVVENVERHMKEGLARKAAAIKAMEEVSAPVIAIVLVLTSVFVPVAFLPGITGQLYKQFALTIALSVAISGFVALTLSPALCAILLQPHHGERKGLFGIFNRTFEGLTRRYRRGIEPLIERPALSVGCSAFYLWPRMVCSESSRRVSYPTRIRDTLYVRTASGRSIQRTDRRGSQKVRGLLPRNSRRFTCDQFYRFELCLWITWRESSDNVRAFQVVG